MVHRCPVWLDYLWWDTDPALRLLVLFIYYTTPQSLRGFQLENEALFANCDTTQTCNGKGQNSCETLQKNCNLCYWNYNSDKCVPTGQPTPRSPTKKPTKKPSSSGYNCQVNKDQCPDNQWCRTSNYGMCSTGSKGQCSYYTGYNGDCASYGNQPVCGCNWTTYKNACYAQAASVNISHNGSC